MTMKRTSAERRAEQLLREAGITSPPIDVEAVANFAGADVVYEKLESEVSALLVKTPKDQVKIGVNALHHRNRQRFSIAHEIGHLLLHAKTPTLFVDDQMVYFRDGVASQATDIREIQANAFAAALIMPEALLKEDLKKQIDAHDEVAVRNLAERYQVSQQALTIRLVNLGLLRGLDGDHS